MISGFLNIPYNLKKKGPVWSGSLTVLYRVGYFGEELEGETGACLPVTESSCFTAARVLTLDPEGSVQAIWKNNILK